jgi:hypothetical protein
LFSQIPLFAQTGKHKPGINTRPAQPGVIPEDTILHMRMNDSLSSKTSRVGDRFTATVTEPVIIDGKVAIPAGATVQGRVTQVNAARRMNKGGAIAVEFEEISLPNGLSTKIDGALTSDDPDIQKQIDDENRVSGGKSKDTAIFVGQSGAIGAVLGAITGGGKGAMVGGAVGAGVGLASVLFSKGEDASVPSGTPFGIRLKQALPVPDDVDPNSVPTFNNGQNESPEKIGIEKGNSTGEINPGRNNPNNSRRDDYPNSTEKSPPPINEEPARPTDNADKNIEESNTTETILPLSSPEMISRAQQALKEQGYYEGEINGELTPRTQNALKVFQHENHLPETGSLDNETARVLKISGPGSHTKSRQNIPPRSNSEIPRNQPSSTPASREEINSPDRSASGISREVIQGAVSIRISASNLLASYQRMIGARMTDNGVEFEKDNNHSDGDIELLFAIDSFSNAANLYNRIAPSLKTTSGMRDATLSLAREARRTDKLFTTSSSRWVNQLNPEWDNIRQSVLKLMRSFNINVSELDN